MNLEYCSIKYHIVEKFWGRKPRKFVENIIFVEKTFADCSSVPLKVPRFQNLRRKLSQNIKIHKSFLLRKFPTVRHFEHELYWASTKHRVQKRSIDTPDIHASMKCVSAPPLMEPQRYGHQTHWCTWIMRQNNILIYIHIWWVKRQYDWILNVWVCSSIFTSPSWTLRDIKLIDALDRMIFDLQLLTVALYSPLLFAWRLYTKPLNVSMTWCLSEATICLAPSSTRVSEFWGPARVEPSFLPPPQWSTLLGRWSTSSGTLERRREKEEGEGGGRRRREGRKGQKERRGRSKVGGRKRNKKQEEKGEGYEEREEKRSERRGKEETARRGRITPLTRRYYRPWYTIRSRLGVLAAAFKSYKFSQDW